MSYEIIMVGLFAVILVYSCILAIGNIILCVENYAAGNEYPETTHDFHKYGFRLMSMADILMNLLAHIVCAAVIVLTWPISIPGMIIYWWADRTRQKNLSKKKVIEELMS
jgi:hypothetical protein